MREHSLAEIEAAFEAALKTLSGQDMSVSIGQLTIDYDPRADWLNGPGKASSKLQLTITPVSETMKDFLEGHASDEGNPFVDG